MSKSWVYSDNFEIILKVQDCALILKDKLCTKRIIIKLLNRNQTKSPKGSKKPKISNLVATKDDIVKHLWFRLEHFIICLFVGI